MVIQVPIAEIKPNPYQPESRIKVDDATAEKFGKSILQYGLLQTPVARWVKHSETEPVYYEMGDGWLRLAGYKWLVKQGHKEFQEIPVDSRMLTDRQMADLLLESNTIRQELNPIERAKFFRKYIEDFKVSQKDLAKDHNISQGELSNTLRLLDLPENIQQKVFSQEISETHARTLLPLKDWPGLLDGLVEKIKANTMPVSTLEDEVRQILGRQKKTKKVEPPAAAPATKQEPVSTQAPEAGGITNVEPPVTKEAPAGPKQPPVATKEPPKITPAPTAPVALKWKRKLALEETDNGVRISLMAGTNFTVKTLPGNLEAVLALAPIVVTDATNQWLEKEGAK